jgi:hypothetical protein
MASLPTKKELRERITAHAEHHRDSDTVHLLWKGYLAALAEWGLLEPDDYHELNELLKGIGEEERREILMGYPGQYE